MSNHEIDSNTTVLILQGSLAHPHLYGGPAWESDSESARP